MKTRNAASLLCGTFPIKQLLSKSGAAAPGPGPFRGVKALQGWSISHLQFGPDAPVFTTDTREEFGGVNHFVRAKKKGRIKHASAAIRPPGF